MSEKLFAVFVATTMCVLSLAGNAAAQGTGSIWDGVYTAAQAARGKTTFEGTCARCHNPELTGSERGPALKGGTFLSNWEDDSLEAIFNKIRDTMPPIGPNTLNEDIKIDILAYILQANAYPAGTTDLKPVGSALEGIKIAKKGIWNGVYTAVQAARVRPPLRPPVSAVMGPILQGRMVRRSSATSFLPIGRPTVSTVCSSRSATRCRQTSGRFWSPRLSSKS